MQGLIKVLLFGLFLAASNAVFAAQDVTCFEGGCLAEGGGWSVYDTRTRAQDDVVCAPDCEFSGWQHQSRGRPIADTHCIRGECFKYGWNTYLTATGEWVNQVLCSKNVETDQPNCFTEGWTTRDIRGRVSFRSECVAGDCLNLGWDTSYPNGQIQIARCKEGGCFESGWILRP